MSPSGKAAGSGPAIRGFESLHPSHEIFALYFSFLIVKTLSGCPSTTQLVEILGLYLGNRVAALHTTLDGTAVKR